MSGVRFQFTFNDKTLREELRRKVARLEDKRTLLAVIGDEFTRAGGVINRRFETETGPDGKKWTPLAPRTIKTRLKRYGNAPLTVLTMRGHLSESINYQITGDTLKIGTGRTVEHYAAIHQFGGQAGRSQKVTIPARPYLGFAEDDMDMIEDEVRAFLMD